MKADGKDHLRGTRLRRLCPIIVLQIRLEALNQLGIGKARGVRSFLLNHPPEVAGISPRLMNVAPVPAMGGAATTWRKVVALRVVVRSGLLIRLRSIWWSSP